MILITKFASFMENKQQTLKIFLLETLYIHLEYMNTIYLTFIVLKEKEFKVLMDI